MSTALEQRQDALPVLNPLSGELVSPAELPKVAEALAACREAKRRMDDARAHAEAVLAAECRRQGKKTLHLDGWTVELSGGSKLLWDVELLRSGLAKAGCPEERIGELITETVEYKVNASVAKQLEGANEAYAEAVRAARQRVEAPERVSAK